MNEWTCVWMDGLMLFCMKLPIRCKYIKNYKYKCVSLKHTCNEVLGHLGNWLHNISLSSLCKLLEISIC